MAPVCLASSSPYLSLTAYPHLAMESNACFVLGARVADVTADPIVFHFQRDLFDAQPAQVAISRNA